MYLLIIYYFLKSLTLSLTLSTLTAVNAFKIIEHFGTTKKKKSIQEVF